MPTATKKQGALQRLDELKQQVQAAEARLHELEAQKREAERDVDRALAPLHEYYRQVGAGEREPDPAVEEELQAGLRAAESESTPRLVYNPRAESDAAAARVEMVNPRLEGMLEGARDALQRCEQEYQRFVAARFEDLVAELAAEAGAVMKRYRAAWDKALEADREWQAVRSRWKPLVDADAFGWENFPESPLSNVKTIPAPVPAQLLDGGSGHINRPSVPKTRRKAA